METNAFGTPVATLSDNRAAVRALDTARRSIAVYAALATTALAVVVAVSSTGHTTSTFMWVRALLLPLVAPVLLRLVAWVSGGSRRSFERLRALTLILPIAIIGIDLIPGVCPLWYAAMQAVCMLPVLHVATLTRGATLRGAFTEAER